MSELLISGLEELDRMTLTSFFPSSAETVAISASPLVRLPLKQIDLPSDDQVNPQRICEYLCSSG